MQTKVETLTGVKYLYSDRANERRRQFNNIIRNMDLVLFNNAPNVDDELYYSENWLGENPFAIRECEWFLNDSKPKKRWCCNTHEYEGDETEVEGTDHDDMCAWAESDGDVEVFQWFAVNEMDAQYLADHHQYVVYSDKLELHLLAITHFGTGWDYTGMVEDFADAYHDLDKFTDEDK